MAYKLDAACLCNTGRVRKNNEDNFYFDGKRMEAENNGLPNPLVMTKNLNQGVCVAVFDGMGGENFGEFASFAAADCMQAMMLKLQSSLPPDRNALNKMCLAVIDKDLTHVHEELGEIFRFAHHISFCLAHRILTVAHIINESYIGIKSESFLSLRDIRRSRNNS